MSVYFLCLHNSYVYLHHVCILLFAGPYKMVDEIVKERVCMLYVYVYLFCGYIVLLPFVYFLQMSVSFFFSLCRQGSFDEVTREREFLSIICLFTPTPLPLGRESNEF